MTVLNINESLAKKNDTPILEAVKLLVSQMEVFSSDMESVKDDISYLKDTSELSDVQRQMIKDKISKIVRFTLTDDERKNRSFNSVAYATIYRDMRAYGMGSKLAYTQKQYFNRVMEALDNYTLSRVEIRKRVEEIKKANEE